MAEGISTPARVPAQSGIYEIVNLVNGKRYVGSALNLAQRWYGHRWNLLRGTHHSIHLQRAWKKGGSDRFSFGVLELVAEVDRLLEREQHYIDTLQPEYNICRVAGSPRGLKHTAETRAKVGEASRRAWRDPKIRERLVIARSEVWLDEGRRQRGRDAARKNWESPEFRSKISASHANRRVTPEFCAAVKQGIAERKNKGLLFGRQINRGLGRTLSDSTKEKLRQANLGRRHSDESKRKMSIARTGKTGAKRSEQARANMRAAWQRGRERRIGLGNAATIAEVYTIENTQGQRLTGIPLELRSQTGISPPAMTQLIKGQQKSARGWRLIVSA